MGEIQVTIPPHRLSLPCMPHPFSLPLHLQHLQQWLVQEQGWEQERGRVRECKRELGREWQTPWTPHLPEALCWAPPHQANHEWDGLAHLVECLKSPWRYSQGETSPPVIAWKWYLDAAAYTLGSRAQGNTNALWNGWRRAWGLGAGGWGLGGEGCGPREEAPTPNGKKIVILKPGHAAACSALFLGLPTGQRYPWRRQVGQALSLFLSLSAAPYSSLFTLIYLPGSQLIISSETWKGNK